ncbi:GNAT family N-acetyltransferase [Arsukibacterium perlucidum]|uniref:GNAT family N-acetyltransferase n=1 Tax=Arsukibacterium perlucidum TaxID=368811 RepID=UPI000372644D|nr:GNAT family N-acetyltransferase [Arsukibacterium perlucidum]
MQLIDFTESDYPILINWICSEKLNYLWGGPVYTYPLTYEQIQHHCSKITVYPYLFRVGSENIGYIELCKEDENCYRVCRVFIADRYKSQGYSKHMLLMLIDEVRVNFGAKTITLAVFEHNVVALNLYTSLGFKAVSKELFKLPSYPALAG